MNEKRLENKIFDEMRKMLVRSYKLDKNEITMNSIYSQLGLDSLDFVNFVIGLENKFGIEIPDEALGDRHGDVESIKTIVNYLRENKGKYINSLIKRGYK